MSKQEQNSGKSDGISIVGLLGVAFIVLKLTGYIDWSWWWVTVPFWGVFGVFAVMWVVCVVAVGAIGVYGWAKSKRKRQ